ncbi:Ger(x)C family spore germination protein [Paenibacillus hodogayensis]|uniref:Ger(X)C family spore germination protein n=1 Tax=Paenibacillus hodogayensis TaxID=279208 RepID=A0ABV5W438_9BACL
MNARVPSRLLLLAVLLFATGCKGNVELNEIHIVHSIALDQGEEGRLLLTAEIAKLTPSGQQPKGMQNDKFFLSYESESLFEAARLMRNKSDRTLLWGHTTVILLSKDVAKQGIAKHIDAIRRLRQIRNSTLLYITEGKAYETMSVASPSASISSQVLRGLVEGGEVTASTRETKLIEVYQELINGYKDVTIPAIAKAADPSEGGKPVLEANGLYAFHGDRLAGLMRGAETKGFLRASNQMSGSVESIGCGSSGQTITFENIASSVTVHTDFDANGKPRVGIDINADLNITSLPCREFEITTESVGQWEFQLNASIAEEIRQFVRYSQKHKTDLLGIGERIHRKYPKQWKALKDDWVERYADVEFDVTVHSRIDHSNFIM